MNFDASVDIAAEPAPSQAKEKAAVIAQQSETRVGTESFTASDGTVLFYDETKATGQTKRAVIALHSFGDYRIAFTEFANQLSQAGIATFALDQRGFGASGDFGVWAGKERMVSDVLEFLQFVRGRVGPETPISLVGESMGGGVALIAASKRPTLIHSLALAAPAVRDNLPFRWAYDVALEVGEAVAPEAAKTLARDDNPLLTQRAQMRLKDDPLVVRTVSMQMYEGLVDLTDEASKAAENVSQPTLLLYGTKDKTIHPKSIKAAAKALRRGQLCRITGAPHLLLQWKDAAPVLHYAQAWLLETKPENSLCEPETSNKEQNTR